MTKEELIKLSRENLRKSKQGSLCECYDEAFIKGYELSEKQIAELEKENKVLAQNLEDTEILNKTYEKRFSKLEKENAELKGEADSVLDNWCKGDDPCPHLKKRDDQLTNAKEIIRKFMKYEINEYDGSLEIHFEELKKQAEQFLKDCEVEK